MSDFVRTLKNAGPGAASGIGSFVGSVDVSTGARGRARKYGYDEYFGSGLTWPLDKLTSFVFRVVHFLRSIPSVGGWITSFVLTLIVLFLASRSVSVSLPVENRGVLALQPSTNLKSIYTEISSPRITPCTSSHPCRIAIIADLDVDSKHEENGKVDYRSLLLFGNLNLDSGVSAPIEWSSPALPVIGKFAEADRGMELSELVNFNGHLLTFDDRTGIVFELMCKNNRDEFLLGHSSSLSLRSSEFKMKSQNLPLLPLLAATQSSLTDNNALKLDPVPRAILTEGDGDSASKGMKIEWATVKDSELYIGSFGKEFTNSAGEVVGENNFWIYVMDQSGEIIRRENWKSRYNELRDAAGVPFPGYMIHEAITWSPHLKQWVVLPRRVSSEPYDEVADEKRGSNIMIFLDEEFKHPKIVKVNFAEKIPERGFSSFKFAPGTEDRIIIALRSEENAEKHYQRTYVSVFDISGTVLVPEQMIPQESKFEGIEIF